MWWQSARLPNTPVPVASTNTGTAVATSDETPQANAQDLTVNVISFSNDPAQRFAMIDGQVVREQEFAKPGVLVQEIQRDAVIVIVRGERTTLRP